MDDACCVQRVKPSSYVPANLQRPHAHKAECVLWIKGQAGMPGGELHTPGLKPGIC
jgi:hypothetical protein